jgi:NO-binding membrane sensor protein with MHYT domain
MLGRLGTLLLTKRGLRFEDRIDNVGFCMSETILEIHKMHSAELRHTATVIWQFSIAIVSLQGGAVAGAVALNSQSDIRRTLGAFFVLAAGFLLSGALAFFLWERSCGGGPQALELPSKENLQKGF